MKIKQRKMNVEKENIYKKKVESREVWIECLTALMIPLRPSFLP